MNKSQNGENTPLKEACDTSACPISEDVLCMSMDGIRCKVTGLICPHSNKHCIPRLWKDKLLFDSIYEWWERDPRQVESRLLPEMERRGELYMTLFESIIEWFVDKNENFFRFFLSHYVRVAERERVATWLKMALKLQVK